VSAYDLSDAATKWLASGERGLSSEAIFERLSGIPVGGRWIRGSAPIDPDDLRRCLLRLDEVPEWKPRIGEMADVSAHWRELVAIWPALVASFEREAASGDRAPVTYAMMRHAEAAARLARH